jgi:hypothetical protein
MTGTLETYNNMFVELRDLAKIQGKQKCFQYRIVLVYWLQLAIENHVERNFDDLLLHTLKVYSRKGAS